MRKLWWGAAVIAAAYLVFSAALVLNRAAFIYPFHQGQVVPAGIPRLTPLQIPRDGMEPLPVWHVAPRDGRPVILYFMGNVGNLALNADRLTELAHQGFGLFAMTYRGGGGAPGHPSEANLAHDARMLWKAAEDHYPTAPRVIYGTSLGTGIAVALAAKHRPTALILETPFTRMCALAQNFVPIVPFCWLMWDERYPSLDRIAKINAPLLVLHGDADRIIPVEMGRAVAKAGQGRFILYPGGRHNDLRLYGAQQDIIAFLNTL